MLKAIGLLTVIMYLFAYGASFADEGTTDIDFDYLPPEVSFFSRITNFSKSFFDKKGHAKSYEAAKRRLYNKIIDTESFYCGCKMDLDGRTFDKESCGYSPRNDNVRAKRIEAEHILPASWIANLHTGESCWKKDPSCGSSRECCLKNDNRFKKAHNDLVNLIPTVGELNADRSDMEYSLIDDEIRNYGSCDFEVKFGDRYAEPRESVRGDVARVYYYMRDTYDLKYPGDFEERLIRWNNSDPISDEERQRNKRIQDVQGTSNDLLK